MSPHDFLPFSNEALWANGMDALYRGGEGEDQLLTTVHDGKEVVLNTSGRHTESKVFEKSDRHDLFVVPSSHESDGESSQIDDLLVDPVFRGTLGLDTLKDPESLHTYLREALGPFRRYDDLQISARIGGEFWRTMWPLTDFVLTHNRIDSELRPRHSRMANISLRSLDGAVAKEAQMAEEETFPEGSAIEAPNACVLQ